MQREHAVIAINREYLVPAENRVRDKVGVWLLVRREIVTAEERRVVNV